MGAYTEVQARGQTMPRILVIDDDTAVRRAIQLVLEQHGYAIRIEESPDVYADAAEMARTDLIVQCMTMSEIGREPLAGLRSAVVAGTGFTGWHGGIADSYSNSTDYLQMVGGQFATHPSKEPGACRGSQEDNYLPYAVQLTDLLGRQHRQIRLVDRRENLQVHHP